MFVGMDHHGKGPTLLCDNSPSSTDKPQTPSSFLPLPDRRERTKGPIIVSYAKGEQNSENSPFRE